MGNDLQKKYGLPTAIALVVGIVIGSGVFFKAETFLQFLYHRCHKILLFLDLVYHCLHHGNDFPAFF